MSGSSSRFHAWAAAALAGLLVLPPVYAQKNRVASYAMIGGTVFRDPGLSVPGVKVVLMTHGETKPKKLQEMYTDDRGEFAFRVPAADATYVLRATMKGYDPQEKEAQITGNQSIDVNLVLSPAVK